MLEKIKGDFTPCTAVLLGLQAASVLHLQGRVGTHCCKRALWQLFNRATNTPHCQIITLPQCYIAFALDQQSILRDQLPIQVSFIALT